MLGLDAMQVMVKNKRKGMCSDIAILPQDMQNPGYQFESSEQGLATIAQYVSAPEWAQLAQGTNAAIERHHYQNKCCVMTAFKLTLGVCFCPMVYVGCKLSERVNNDVAALPVAQQLMARGFALKWHGKTKLDIGGLLFTLPAQPAARSAAPVAEDVPAMQLTPVGKSMQRE